MAWLEYAPSPYPFAIQESASLRVEVLNPAFASLNRQNSVAALHFRMIQTEFAVLVPAYSKDSRLDEENIGGASGSLHLQLYGCWHVFLRSLVANQALAVVV
jgi:hypothetical protein